MNEQPANYVYLAPNAKSAYKQLFVKGTRIRARTLYGWYACAEPMTPDEIAREFDLPLEAVQEAIAYCQSDPPELLDDYAREEALNEAAGINDADYKLNPSPRLIDPQDIARINRS
ncbi:MAG TPA: DUF433 domain-containing protein [Gemmataceae bacterium]|jgi:uncharacterized protein (DUF433 family)